MVPVLFLGHVLAHSLTEGTVNPRTKPILVEHGMHTGSVPFGSHVVWGCRHFFLLPRNTDNALRVIAKSIPNLSHELEHRIYAAPSIVRLEFTIRTPVSLDSLNCLL